MKGICLKCGAIYYGWALENPLDQKCEYCGSSLEISESPICTGIRCAVLSYPEYKITRDRMKEAMTVN
jgi:transcription initiation factor IIE alpha subunit